MARKDSQKKDQSAEGDGLEGNVDQIRQILFGGQMRDYEKRFDALENRLTRSIEQLSNSIEKKMERLDAHSKREIQKLAEQVKGERKARTDGTKQTQADIDGLGRQVETWFAEVEEQLESEARQLRASMKEQGDELHGMIQEASEAFSSSLDGQSRELAETKLGREDLAELLAEVALRLKKEVKLPKG